MHTKFARTICNSDPKERSAFAYQELLGEIVAGEAGPDEARAKRERSLAEAPGSRTQPAHVNVGSDRF